MYGDKSEVELKAKIPEIQIEAERLGANTESLEKSLEALFGRLASVIRIEPDGNMEEKEPQNQTALGQRLQTSRIKLEKSIYRINQLMRLLEL